MIKSINQACSKLNKALGIALKLPQPGRKALRAAAIANFGLGVGLLTAGFFGAGVWCAALGGLVLVGSAAMWLDSQRQM